MRSMIIENVDLMTKDQEETLKQTLKKMNIEYKEESVEEEY
jgi:hypothetical protein